MRLKHSRRPLARTVIVWSNIRMPPCTISARIQTISAVGDSVAETAGEPIAGRLQAANDEMAEYLRTHATKLLNDVLYTSSNLMRNGFAMSDRWN